LSACDFCVTDNESSQLEGPVVDTAIGHAPQSEIVQAELVEPRPPVRRRRVLVPVVLFLLTCVSTFMAGAAGWMPAETAFGGGFELSSPTFQLPLRLAILEHWRDGLIYMACVLAILLTHEMGHFVMTVVYRVRSTLPLFIPLPISAIGTMGAVIAMDGSKADRKQIFDIGLAGPLAGLVVAIPIVWIGILRLDLSTSPDGIEFGLPLAVQWLMQSLRPDIYRPGLAIGVNQLNPYFMAGWVGLLVTGLNMMPVSQLDGGHVTYALFGRKAHWLARFFMLVVFIYMGAMLLVYQMPPAWMLMAFLVLLIGTDHPPTRDDSVRLGWFRVALGLLSLLIPVFCFAPNLVR
jgi:membrane-associated protease RseP (regulator of RpoE activity)